MPLENDTVYGNLQNYKLYIRPNAHNHYGSSGKNKSALNKHQQSVQSLLKIMSRNEPMTTWDLAKISLPNDTSKLREREKIYRRLLVGRKDRGKHSDGILDLGLAVRDGKSLKTGTADKYRLSLHGVLYCIDVLELDEDEIDGIAQKYSKILPKVFGRWEYVKSRVGQNVYGIRLLSNGLLADNPQIQVQCGVPFYELMSYVHIKYQRNFEHISEGDLAEQISYWFYINLMYRPVRKNSRESPGISMLNQIFKDDAELEGWFLVFFRESKKYYYERYDVMRKSEAR